MSDKEKTPLDLWDAVCRTNPAYAKKFSRGGGFSGTATNGTYLVREATQQFGPYGIGWGIEILNEDYIEGAPIIIDGAVVTHEKIHVLRIKLWYILDGVRGEVPHFGQTTFVGKNKHGPFTDEEAPKKSLTDAMSKALSMLGFAADIHLGLYDDNKYVAKITEEFAEPPPAITPAQVDEIADRLKEVGADTGAFLAWLKADSLDVIPANSYARVMAALDQKEKAQQNDKEPAE